MKDLLPNLANQQRALKWAIALATSPLKESGQPLSVYVQALPEPLRPAAAPGVYHLLYCSQALSAFEEEQLADLLEHSLARNTRRNITGLLCYGNGHFVQVLEGQAADVESLFARIADDQRHHRVHVLSRGLGPVRCFTDWRMAFAKTHTQEFYWLITFLEAHHHRLLLRQVPVDDPDLATQLDGFSKTCVDVPGI